MKAKPRVWVGNLLLLVLGILLTGCPAGTSSRGPALKGKIAIKGSNTIGEELAPRLIEEYRKDQPEVTFELESKGTGSGFAALLASECDIAAASRVASQDELTQARNQGVELNLHTIGSYSVAVIVNAGNPVSNLSRDQVRDIFTGKVRNWQELGGAAIPIRLFIRDAISGTPLGFQELAMENQPYATDASAFTNYAGIEAAVAKDAGGIGYVGLDLAKLAGVNAVSIRGVPPTAVTVNEGQYPIARVLRLYTNKTNESPVTLDFIRFVQSPRGQKILADMGFVPRL
ncbi:MAG: phosphate ABC transporter substrate-binding protein [Verrucomicrobia bacterium]|nr:phosphate ABC transporter substrate-binding protein [Verrucomicrobiota bacterium]